MIHVCVCDPSVKNMFIYSNFAATAYQTEPRHVSAGESKGKATMTFVVSASSQLMCEHKPCATTESIMYENKPMYFNSLSYLYNTLYILIYNDHSTQIHEE